MKKVDDWADLFCGAGGTTTGLFLAAARKNISIHVLAINHWDMAVATHKANHSSVVSNALCKDLDNVNPRVVVPSGRLKGLVASPECMSHSNARGGTPINDQSRATAWHVIHWADALYISELMVENVPEFLDWGPLGANGKRLKSKKGQTFQAFIASLRAMNYYVDYRILNAANYGDPTTRKRLFIRASKSHKIVWPEQTHFPPGKTEDMFGSYQPWRTAKEIIDWDHKGKSIYTRNKALSPNTLRRIYAGLEKFSGGAFTIGQQSKSFPRSVDEPIQTIAGKGAISLVQPWLMNMEHTTGGDKRYSYPMTRPLPTITGKGQWGFLEPFLVQLNGTDGQHLDNSSLSVDEPVPAITGSAHTGLVDPYLIQYYGTSGPQSVEVPLPTVTPKDRFGLCEPMIISLPDGEYKLDILFRMLEPGELAAAMSFPADYKFVGTKTDARKMVGNAVPIELSAALCSTMM